MESTEKVARKCPTPKFDVSSPNILQLLFTPEHGRRAIRRMRAWQEAENEVTHPLRKIILLEYEEGLATGLAAAVAAGSWSPSPSYVVLVAKRSGTYRELAFPSLLDTIVGRQIIDALEPHITADDNNRVFFGRSHANADRERGDYENWFKVWLDFSAEVGSALEADGFTYVFDTDITQFFPSVDRERAKGALAQRTRAHQTLLELLFYCLEAWAPRIRYCAVPGLPIEPNDVSRLVAHNYIKGVDEHFVGDPAIKYLRWVDDTVIFVSNERAAHELKRRHHLALREMGLSPNASKTSITTAAEYGASRHPEFNRAINDALNAKDAVAISVLVEEWYGRSREETPSWDKVATRLYSAARLAESDSLRQYALDDIVRYPTLARAAFKYLARFDLQEQQLEVLLAHYGRLDTSIETRIEIARFLCDVPLASVPSTFADSIVGQVCEVDVRLGSGYARALFLLCLNKYGTRAHRDKVRKLLTLEQLQDDQLRLHYLYVFHCRGELPEATARAVRHLDTTDIALMTRVCQDAIDGRLTKHARCLATCVSTRAGRRTVEARHLPFLHALLRAPTRTSENLVWLRKATETAQMEHIRDPAVRRFLSEELTVATR
jgi:hypothetical protein